MPKEIISKCIDSLPLVYIARSEDNGGVKVIMAPITEAQEQQLDNEECIVVKDQFNHSFVVEPKACYAYGKLDLSPKSDDMDKISRANWFNKLYINIYMFTDYDYNTNIVTSDVIGGRWYETSNISTYLPFLHGKIGKPERVVIFRDFFDVFASKKHKHKNKVNTNAKKDYASFREYCNAYNRNKTILKRKDKVSKLHFKIKK